jgi:hypothetical protein
MSNRYYYVGGEEAPDELAPRGLDAYLPSPRSTEYSLVSPFRTMVTFTWFDGGGGGAATGAGGEAEPAAPAQGLCDRYPAR